MASLATSPIDDHANGPFVASKREYLLAQIRQKDAIIESLLKQLHNPYIATPLSIASYRLATSPSDQQNRNILDWLDRLQRSVNSNGMAGDQAFRLDSRASQDDGDDSADDMSPSHTAVLSPAQAYGEFGASSSDSDSDKIRSALPDVNVPLGLIASLSLSGARGNNAKGGKVDIAGLLEEDDLDDDNVGVANETYFMPGPATDLNLRATLIEQHSPPEILVHGLVTPEDVEKLFEMYEQFSAIGPFVHLLDPVLHNPALTFARCPFLFTVICAISSRYYAEKSEIYPIAMHFAKHSAANALIDGWKSVELCQAYILMSIYAVPARRWEEDRSWLYTGLAIRIATDLNLHQTSSMKPQNEKQEREILNRTRVWLICFNLDRSTATQFGKPFTIKEDYVVKHAKDWYKKSPYNSKYDVHLCAHNALLRIVARFHEEIFSDPSSPSGLNKQIDFKSVTEKHDEFLKEYHHEWQQRFKDDSDPEDPGAALRCLLLPFLVNYSRLVMFSFGFQKAYQRGMQPGDDFFFNTCLESAKNVIRHMIEHLAPTGYMRYAPDGHFIFSSFASAFLLKLLRSEFANIMTKNHENDIFDLISRLIQTLSSPDIAIDDRHTPKLYARFLAGLLSRHRRDGATVGRLHPPPPPPPTTTKALNPHPGRPGDGWPSSTGSYPSAPPGSSAPGDNYGQGQSYQQDYNMHMPSNGSAMGNAPVYHHETSFSAGSTLVPLGGDFDAAMELGNGVSDEEILATMQPLNNPGFWKTMMLPG
ncbi:hypothetical protein FISHEDRAFT_48653 [Fistulina hepatica ATCC 64428]|uniref:Xylanolytic transcriptional activator regulatory domain-containing protein n=1 Tax=Fistulina hepatica ATCC 64428 TaxID=1128425 RepID=A0A0D7A7D4_9AGAR|nr:hypothetical protein FISHEDRAFT_48653 [Fistulina hepatica ATCC 64428]